MTKKAALRFCGGLLAVSYTYNLLNNNFNGSGEWGLNPSNIQSAGTFFNEDMDSAKSGTDHFFLGIGRHLIGRSGFSALGLACVADVKMQRKTRGANNLRFHSQSSGALY
ncbi:MAG: hypothetical protein J7621_07855 [Niastella sp.]|nr:hypothetical protein [Niastella sp.]